MAAIEQAAVFFFRSPKLKKWKVSLKLILRLTSTVLLKRNCGRTIEFCPRGTMASRLQPDVLTERKQTRPSIYTTQPGVKLSFAKAQISTELKPNSGSGMALIGCFSSFRERAKR